ncbi:hypothetical protein ACFFK7_10210 [Pseudoalteromonas xiamenensis]|uniref:hypothetical protein n=1 Tax=Pseudoalteromonas xiamenensis TaxID=882626 RepID=UPI0035EC2044
MKLSMREGSSIPNYLVQVGTTVLVVGLVGTVFGSGWVSSSRAQLFAILMGSPGLSQLGLWRMLSRY